MTPLCCLGLEGLMVDLGVISPKPTFNVVAPSFLIFVVIGDWPSMTRFKTLFFFRPQDFHRGLHYLKLFRRSRIQLLPHVPPLETMNRYTKKEILQVPFTKRGSMPLSSFYFLNPINHGKRTLRELDSKESFWRLVQSTFNPIPNQQDRLRNHFAEIMKFSTSIPMFELTYPRTYKGLSETSLLILENESL